MDNVRVSAIVNAVIPPATLPAALLIQRADWGQVEAALRDGTPHYIRHPSTAKLLGAEPNAGFYSPQPGDVYLVVRLRAGTAPRGTEVETRIDDLDVMRVEVLRLSPAE